MNGTSWRSRIVARPFRKSILNKGSGNRVWMRWIHKMCMAEGSLSLVFGERGSGGISGVSYVRVSGWKYVITCVSGYL